MSFKSDGNLICAIMSYRVIHGIVQVQLHNIINIIICKFYENNGFSYLNLLFFDYFNFRDPDFDVS